uniref:Dihydrofolate synthase/folylpolyglutamate synthase n=1 Tax=Prevotella sp. GTC17253 TaxID=3236793 RepID=A0AB33ISE3_9BACT
MNYKETVEYLFNSTPVFEHVGATAYKEGLSNTHILDKHFGSPHQGYKTIHIAGTNGKGSCSHTLASILQASGYKVGLYTSPHLIDFRERIRVNGESISEEYVVDFVAKEKEFFHPLHPSFFELTTALAFKYFKDAQVDIAVIEVGLGGRLDCTNIITPLLSIITNISFDHTQFLGNTITKISTEKAGIIKPFTPVVIGEYTEESKPVFLQKATECSSPIIFAEDCKDIIEAKVCPQGGIDYQSKQFGHIHGELSGTYQIKNTNTVLAAISLLQQSLHISQEDIRTGFADVCKTTGLMGRWMTIREVPKVICDTGHNVGGWKYIASQLRNQQYKTLHMVFGMVDDKDIMSVMEMLPPDATFYWTRAYSKRAIPAERIQTIGDSLGYKGQHFPTVEEAYLEALKYAAKEDLIFVGGSSYIVADLLTFLRSATNH